MIVFDEEGVELTDLSWSTLPRGECIGIVLCVDRALSYWKTYIGVGSGRVMREDITHIYHRGVRFDRRASEALTRGMVDGLEFAG